MLPGNQKKKVCDKFEPQAWRKVLCKNCFKTNEEHAIRVSPGLPSSIPKTNSLEDLNQGADPNQRDIIRKSLGASPRQNPKFRHSVSLDGMTFEEFAGKDDGGFSPEVHRRSVSPGLVEPKIVRPATPFVGHKSMETTLNETEVVKDERIEPSIDKKEEIKIVTKTRHELKLELVDQSRDDKSRLDDAVEDENEVDEEEKMNEAGGKKTDDVFVRNSTEQAGQTFLQQRDFQQSAHSTPTLSNIKQTTSSSEHDAASCAVLNSEAIGSQEKFHVATTQINNFTALNLLRSVDNSDNFNNSNKCDDTDILLAEKKLNNPAIVNKLDDSKSNSDRITSKICDDWESRLVIEADETSSPVEFYYDGTRIKSDNQDQPVTSAFSSTINVTVANRTIQLNPSLTSSGSSDIENKITDRRFISYLANDSISAKDINLVSKKSRSYCDEEDMSSYDFLRSEAMMEGQKLLMESLRERNASLEEQFQKMEREKTAIIEILTNKKNDYERMKDHYNATISELDSQVQKLQSEKNRLLEKLQLPEGERSSLAAEENEIAELKCKLEDYENRYFDVASENEELKQEVKDVQLEMAELHDQFREEETLEFRELQKELEAAAKNYRIIQFKLRKAERHNEQLENDRMINEEKLKHFESCIQTSDDKRRVRLLEEEMRATKEANQRLHEELNKIEEKRRRASEDLDRTKNSLNDADSKRLCLQNQIDNMKHEIGKLREQLKYENRHDYVSPTKPSPRTSIPSDHPIITQLTKDLKDSLERENDLKEQLRFAEKECSTMRKKLTDMDGECEGLNLQIRKLTTAKMSRYSRSDPRMANNVDGESDSELSGQLEIAEQEIRDLKRQQDNIQKENESLLVAIKYLRGKLEQREGVRCSTPIGEPKYATDFLSRIANIPDSVGREQELKDQLEANKKEFFTLQEKYNRLMENVSNKPCTSDASVVADIEDVDKQQEEEIKRRMEENLHEYKDKVDELIKEQDRLKEELSLKSKEIDKHHEILSDLERSGKDLESAKESNNCLEMKVLGLSEQIEKLQRDLESSRKVDVVENTEGDETELKRKFEELQEKLKQREEDWAKEREDIEEEANVGCDVATKINRELSSLNEQLMDEKLKLLKDKENLIKEKELLSNEKDRLSDEIDKLIRDKSQREKLAKPENDFKIKEESLKKQFHEEKNKFEAQINELEDKMREVEKRNESLDKKYRKVVSKREKEEVERKEVQDELQALKEKFDKKLYKETEKRRRSEVFIDENKGNEMELLIKLRRDVEDKEKVNEKLNKKLKKAEETQLKLETELKEMKKNNISIQSRSPGDGEDHSTDENGNKMAKKNQNGDVTWYMEQMKILQIENEKLSNSTQTTVGDIKKLFEEQRKSSKNDKDEIARLKKTIEENQKQLSKCDNDLEELKDRLRRETSAKVKLETKLKSLENGNSSDQVSDSKKPSSLTSEEKKAMEFRSRFEKFGGTARTGTRKLCIPSTFEAANSTSSSSSSSLSSSSSSSDFHKDVQKQLVELEAARSKDREELLKKIEKQKLEFQKEATMLEDKNKQLEDRLQEWSKCQEDILQAQMEFEKERNEWNLERGKLQDRLNLALKTSSSTKEFTNLIIPSPSNGEQRIRKSPDVVSGGSKNQNSSETKSSVLTSRFSRSFHSRP